MPLTDDELNDKFLELAEPVLGKAPARALLEQLWRTEALPAVEYQTQGARNSAKELETTLVHGEGEPAV
jgi:hypothetical protein